MISNEIEAIEKRQGTAHGAHLDQKTILYFLIFNYWIINIK